MPPDEPTRHQDLAQIPTGTYQALAPQDPLIGQVLKNAYRLEGKVGEGGMGVVYRATQIALGRPVAVKLVLMDGQSTSLTDRFLREARLLSQLQHPNIVQIIDFGHGPESQPFMVMEFLQGDSALDFVKTRGRLGIELVVDLMEQICAGVATAHAASIIHRDLKPGNIFITHVTGSPRPLVKILDFGLAKLVAEETAAARPTLTRVGMMMGTVSYSAPEQLQGDKVDSRADIYSLGAVCYYLLSGNSPFLEKDLQATLVKQLSQGPDPFPADLQFAHREAVEAVLCRAMSPRAENRHPSVQEFFADLLHAVWPGETIPDVSRLLRQSRSGSTVPMRGLARKPHRRKILGLAASGVVLGGTLGGGLLWWLNRRQPRLRATAPGVTASEIRLGMSGPFAGPTRELGRAMLTGIETFFRQVNAEGGVHGRQLRLIGRDDGYEPERAEENMRRLLNEDEVFAFIGNVGTPTTERALPIALQHKRVFFGAYTGASLLRHSPPDRYVFNYRASYADETAAIVGYLLQVRELKPDRIAVLTQNDGYGDSGFQGVARALRGHGIHASQILRVGYQRNTSNVDAAVATILAARERVQAIVMVSTYKPAARFIQQVREVQQEMLFSNVSFVGSEALAEELRQRGPRFAKDILVTQVVPNFQGNASCVLRYRELLGQFFPSEPPGFVSLEGYLAANIFVEGLRRAGPELTSETLVEGLEQIHDFDVGSGAPIRFGPSSHEGSKKVWGTRLDEKGIYHDLDLE